MSKAVGYAKLLDVLKVGTGQWTNRAHSGASEMGSESHYGYENMPSRQSHNRRTERTVADSQQVSVGRNGQHGHWLLRFQHYRQTIIFC